MACPLHVRIVACPDLSDLGIAVAEHDTFHAKPVISDASIAGNACVVIEEIEETLIIHDRARYTQGGVQSSGQIAASSYISRYPRMTSGVRPWPS